MVFTKTRILLLNPNISGDLRYGKFKDVGSYLPPYGLLSIASVLEQHGHSVKVLDADSRVGLTLNDLEKIIKYFEPNIIGMTVYSIGRDKAVETARFIKSLTEALLIAGGPHVTLLPEDLAQYDCFDILAIGEGDYAMVDIAQYYSNDFDLNQINGIIYKDNGQLVKTPSRDYIKNLDSLPYPAFHLLDNLHSYKPMPLLYKRSPGVVIISGRGCPYNCIFCNSLWGKKVRFNSATYILDLMKKMIKEFDIKEIMFYEDTFCLNKERIYELCDLILKEKLDVTWSCSANIRGLDKPLLSKMKEAGCWLISIGIESGSDKILKFIKKPSTTMEVRNVCTWADEVGLKVRGFFMLGHPIDTKGTIRQTINFAKSLPLFTINFCILQLVPGSKVREIAHNYGEVNYDLSLGTGHPGDTLSFVPRGLTSEYLKKMQRRGYTEFFLRPAQVWRLLRSIDLWEDIKKYFILTIAFIKLYL